MKIISFVNHLCSTTYGFNRIFIKKVLDLFRYFPQFLEHDQKNLHRQPR